LPKAEALIGDCEYDSNKNRAMLCGQQGAFPNGHVAHSAVVEQHETSAIFETPVCPVDTQLVLNRLGMRDVELLALDVRKADF
jgi:hypothetical protein